MKIKRSAVKELVNIIEILVKVVPDNTNVIYERQLYENNFVNVKVLQCRNCWSKATYRDQIEHKPDCLELQRLALPNLIEALKVSLGLVDSDKSTNNNQDAEKGFNQPLSEYDKVMATYAKTVKDVQTKITEERLDSLEQILAYVPDNMKSQVRDVVNKYYTVKKEETL